MTDELVALLAGRIVGMVRRDRRDQLSFTYDEIWRAAAGAYPLLLSMPLAAAAHGHKPVEALDIVGSLVCVEVDSQTLPKIRDDHRCG